MKEDERNGEGAAVVVSSASAPHYAQISSGVRISLFKLFECGEKSH